MSLAEETENYVESHPSIKSCLASGLINYSALARMIAAELGHEKESSFDAILIACRRIADKSGHFPSNDKKIMSLMKEGKFELKTKVSVMIINQNISLDSLITQLSEYIQKSDNFHIIQGTKTITIVTDDDSAKQIAQKIKPCIIKYSKGLVQVTYKTSEKIEETKGFLAYIAAIFSENDVNIYEAMSSWTDTILLIDQKDAPKIYSLLNRN